MRVPNYSEDERELARICVLRLVLGKNTLRLLRLRDKAHKRNKGRFFSPCSYCLNCELCGIPHYFMVCHTITS